jgi:hypothetical protein
MRTAACLLFAVTLLRAGEPVEFRAELRAGDGTVVTEEERIEGKIRYEAVKGKSKADFGKRKTEFLSLKRWQYDEEVVEVGEKQSKRLRNFGVATKEEFEEESKDRKVTQFPHQREVTVARTPEGQAVYIEGEQAEEGLEEQGWTDVLPSMLPAEPVAVGKEFEIDGKAVAKAWSKGIFGDKGTTGSGKGKYAEDVKLGRVRCAKLYVNVTMHGEGKDLPTIDVTVTGYVWFALEERRIVKAELSGPIVFKMRVKDSEIGDVDVVVTGTLRENFVAEAMPK